jgi:hypothetical protein
MRSHARRITARILPLLALAAVPAFAQQAGLAALDTPFLDTSSGIGLPCVGCTLKTYAAGTNTPLKTYTDSSLTTQNPVSITLNSAGYSTSGVWIGGACYKFVLVSALGVTLRTQDHICDNQQAFRASQALPTFLMDSGFGSLASACAAAIAGNQTLAVATAWTSGTTTCGALWFLKGGKITVTAGGVITMPVPVAPGNQQIFDTTTNAGASVVVTGPGDLQMGWWGADPAFSVDSTTKIQAALSAATDGQGLRCGRGVYKISSPLIVPAYVNWTGVRADLESGQSQDGGCMLKWAGSAPATYGVPGSSMLQLAGVYGTRLDGINLDGANTANLTGYMLYSKRLAPNATSSQRNSYRNALIQHFGNPATGVAGAGMVLGSTDGDQADGNEFTGFYMVDVNEGIVSKSRNVDYTLFQSFGIAGVNVAIHITAGGYATYMDGSVGTMQGANPHVFLFDGQWDPTQIIQMQAENDSGTGNPAEMLTVATGLLLTSPIILTSNTFDFPSSVGSTSRIVSSGNNFNKDMNITGDNVTVVASNDEFTGGAVVNITGVNSNWAKLGPSTTDGALQTWEQNTAVGPINHFHQMPHSGVAEGYNQFTGITGQQWRHTFSASTFCSSDHTASDFKFLCADAGMSGTDGIAMHRGYTTINGLRVDGTGSLRIYVNSQAGSNNAITITTPNGLQPAEGDQYSIRLTANSLGGGVANTITVNGGAAHSILNSKNSGFITSGYAVSGMITVVLDSGGSFRDVSQ